MIDRAELFLSPDGRRHFLIANGPMWSQQRYAEQIDGLRDMQEFVFALEGFKKPLTVTGKRFLFWSEGGARNVWATSSLRGSVELWRHSRSNKVIRVEVVAVLHGPSPQSQSFFTIYRVRIP